MKKNFPSGALDGKNIKIVSIKDEGNKDVAHDIKNIGNYKVTISLLKEVSAEFTLCITKLDEH
jgi:ribosomal protein L9